MMELNVLTADLEQENDAGCERLLPGDAVKGLSFAGFVKTTNRTVFIHAGRSTEDLIIGPEVSDRSRGALTGITPEYVYYALVTEGASKVSDLGQPSDFYHDSTRWDAKSEYTQFVAQPAAPAKAAFELPHDAEKFCFTSGLSAYLPQIFDLIQSCFQKIDRYCFRLQTDPEIPSEEWLVLELGLSGNIDEIAKSYEEYIQHIISLVPEPQRGKFSLIFNID